MQIGTEIRTLGIVKVQAESRMQEESFPFALDKEATSSLRVGLFSGWMDITSFGTSFSEGIESRCESGNTINREKA